MLDRLHTYRFEIFLISQITILFGSLVVTSSVFDMISPLLFLANIVAGSLFLGFQGRVRIWMIVSILLIIGSVFSYAEWDRTNHHVFDFLKVGLLFLLHIVITYRIITQIWRARQVSKNVIFGVMSGFISLGLIGFFLCISIEMLHPNSFSEVHTMNSVTNTITERLMYFSYITLLTIGYGDILPLSHLAQKATILIGLVGQFYLVIITGIVVGKFINQSSKG